MHILERARPRLLAAILAATAVSVSGCSYMQKDHMGGGSPMYGMHGERLTLSGSNEVPSVSTGASATGTIAIGNDHDVSGSIKVSGMTPTAAHIHQGAAGTIGPVIIPLTKNGDTFSVPANAKLTDAQYTAYKSGNLYVNVHSTAHPIGEIRAQLKGS